MKVKEFAKRLGINSSKVRYYDRVGFVDGERVENNNYRDFQVADALSIYSAIMLRSLDMSIDQSLNNGESFDIAAMNSWMDYRIESLEEEIILAQERLKRMRKMSEYFEMIRNNVNHVYEQMLDDSYNIASFGSGIELNEARIIAMEQLANAMPYSYIYIEIDKDSLNQETLDVRIGLGILKSNVKRARIDIPSDLECHRGGRIISQIVEVTNPFELKRADIIPLLEEMKQRNIELKDNIFGRIYLNYQRDGQRVYGMGIGVDLE